MVAKLTAFFLLLVLSSTSAFAGDLKSYATLSDYELRKLSQGKTVLDSADAGEYVREVIVFIRIKAPASLIFSQITDFPKLHEFMPNVEKTTAIEQSDSGAIVNYELGLPFGVEKRYRLKLDYEIGDTIRKSWQLVPWQGLSEDETIKDTSGYWLLQPTENEHETLVTYFTRTDPGSVPFGLGWIVDFMTNKAAVALLKNTKERAEKLWQEKGN